MTPHSTSASRTADRAVPEHVVVSDFDGTMLMEDTSVIVLNQFGEGDWERYDSLVLDGQMTLNEGIRVQFGMIKAASIETILRKARDHFALRTGFSELHDFCQTRRIPLFVASGGLDFCIDYVLKAHRLGHVKVVCPRTRFHPDGIGVTFPEEYSKKGKGDFKAGLVTSHGERGSHVTYVGNGLSDYQAGRLADELFVIRESSLDRHCEPRDIHCTRIMEFDPVTSFLRASISG